MTAKKKKKKRKKVVVEEIKSDNESGSNSEAELMRDLPNGLMAIPPAKHFNNVGSSGGVSCRSPLRDVKIGGDPCSVSRRCFRSKNIEPKPIATLQVVCVGHFLCFSLFCYFCFDLLVICLLLFVWLNVIRLCLIRRIW